MAIPIPSRPSGYRIGAADAPVTVEMFFDLECPFSKRGWGNVQQVMKAYDKRQVAWVFQPMTLGNHRQSWDATKSAIAASDGDPQKFVDFVGHIFARQEEFANEAWKDHTQTEFHHLLAEIAVDHTDYADKAAFIERLTSEEVYAQARIPARFATIRGVWSTPTFFINGAEADMLSSGSDLAAWKDVLDGLLAS